MGNGVLPSRRGGVGLPDPVPVRGFEPRAIRFLQGLKEAPEPRAFDVLCDGVLPFQYLQVLRFPNLQVAYERRKQVVLVFRRQRGSRRDQRLQSLAP